MLKCQGVSCILKCHFLEEFQSQIANHLIDLQSTQHGFYKVPPTPRFFMSVDSHSLSRRRADSLLNCPLIWAILKPRVLSWWSKGRDNTVDCRSFGNQNPNLFYLRTNNATKWQINQTTVNSNVHFTVDAIMYMYVNNLTGLHDSRYTMYASVEWRG